jgi:transposase
MALIELTAREFFSLQKLLSQPIDSRLFQRIQALLWLDAGESVDEVADRLTVTRQSIYNWISRFEARADLPFELRIGDGKRSGRPPTALGIIDSLIDAIIELDPRTLGYASTIWTAALLQQYLADKHQVRVSSKSVNRAIARLDITWKRPRYQLSRRDPSWRQAKGGLNAASGCTPEGSC